MKINNIIIIYLSIFCVFLFFFFFYMKHCSLFNINRFFQKEYFENTCQSTNGDFIVITDDNDPRCLKNQVQSKKDILEIDENQLDNLSCITTQNEWGILENGICMSLHSSQSKKNKNKKNNQNSNQNNTNNNTNPYWNGFEYVDINTNSSISIGSNIQQEEEEENTIIQSVRSCDKEKLPNSLPCFISESFQNASTDYDKQCKQTYGKDFGFYKQQTINGNTSVNCRKYYVPTLTNNVPDYGKEGTYQPEKYNIYIPKNNDKNEKAMTGCHPSDYDFNDICRRTQNSSLYGVFKLLKGKDGNCYYENGLENTLQSNAICSQNYQNEIPKVKVYQPPFSNLSTSSDSPSTYYPNLFTKCDSKDTDFNQECKKMLSNLKAEDIQGYDCPIGQYRSKCIYE